MTVEIPAEATIPQRYSPAVKLATEGRTAEALAWFEALVRWYEAGNLLDPTRYPTREAIEQLVRGNIGYWAGYYGEAERRAVREVYGALHPIFGEDFNPSPQKALEAGRRMASGEFG